MLDTIDSSGWGSTSGDDFWQRAYDPSANYGASNFDARNVFKGSAIYDLPVGRGRQFLNNNWLLDEVIGGWQVAPTIVWSSGTPFTLSMPNNTNSFSQAGQWYPNQIGNPNPAHRSLNEWYDPSAFEQPADGTFGNTRRNNLYGPQYLLINAAVGKTFHIWESVNFELRASANNVINHPSFANPNGTINGGQAGVINDTTVKGRTMQATHGGAAAKAPPLFVAADVP
jgi:hypothetical protein